MIEVTRDDIGMVVEFYDTRGKCYDALITNVFGPQCINLKKPMK